MNMGNYNGRRTNKPSPFYILGSKRKKPPMLEFAINAEPAEESMSAEGSPVPPKGVRDMAQVIIKP